MSGSYHSFLYLPIAMDVGADGEHGEVFTRPWVVELILDLVGYTGPRRCSRR
ncbi:MAG TPA: hypothetical protein VH478_14715 [Trebonia sp.]|jgi:hypothetical protein|nr:hypothetical protein [Trebonia sp.]